MDNSQANPRGRGLEDLYLWAGHLIPLCHFSLSFLFQAGTFDLTNHIRWSHKLTEASHCHTCLTSSSLISLDININQINQHLLCLYSMHPQGTASQVIPKDIHAAISSINLHISVHPLAPVTLFFHCSKIFPPFLKTYKFSMLNFILMQKRAHFPP